MNNRFLNIKKIYKLSSFDEDIYDDYADWESVSPIGTDPMLVREKWGQLVDSGKLNGQYSRDFDSFSYWIDKKPRFKNILSLLTESLEDKERVKLNKDKKRISFDYNRWKEEIGNIESRGNYKAKNKHTNALGKYQFVPRYFWSDIKRFSNNTVKDYSDFLNNPSLQEDFMEYYTYNNLMRHLESFRARGDSELPGVSLLSDGKILALLHFQGPYGAEKWLKSGVMQGADINISVNDYLNKIT